MAPTYIPSDNRAKTNLVQASEEGEGGEDQGGDDELPLVEYIEEG